MSEIKLVKRDPLCPEQDTPCRKSLRNSVTMTTKTKSKMVETTRLVKDFHPLQGDELAKTIKKESCRWRADEGREENK